MRPVQQDPSPDAPAQVESRGQGERPVEPALQPERPGALAVPPPQPPAARPEPPADLRAGLEEPPARPPPRSSHCGTPLALPGRGHRYIEGGAAAGTRPRAGITSQSPAHSMRSARGASGSHGPSAASPACQGKPLAARAGRQPRPRTQKTERRSGPGRSRA